MKDLVTEAIENAKRATELARTTLDSAEKTRSDHAETIASAARAVEIAGVLAAELRKAHQLLEACGWKRDEPTGSPNQTPDGWLDEADGRGRLETSTDGACATARARTAAQGDAREVVQARKDLEDLDEHRGSLVRQFMQERDDHAAAKDKTKRLEAELAAERGTRRQACERAAALEQDLLEAREQARAQAVLAEEATGEAAGMRLSCASLRDILRSARLFIQGDVPEARRGELMDAIVENLDASEKALAKPGPGAELLARLEKAEEVVSVALDVEVKCFCVGEHKCNGCRLRAALDAATNQAIRALPTDLRPGRGTSALRNGGKA